MIQVTCAIILKDGKILVTQRSESMKLPLKWEFPGGKLEEGENEVDCIIREIKEELNIDIRITKPLTPQVHDYGTFKINLIPFLAEYVSGEIILAEHQAYKMLDQSKLKELDWAEADIEIVNEVVNSKL